MSNPPSTPTEDLFRSPLNATIAFHRAADSSFASTTSWPTTIDEEQFRKFHQNLLAHLGKLQDADNGGSRGVGTQSARRAPAQRVDDGEEEEAGTVVRKTCQTGVGSDEEEEYQDTVIQKKPAGRTAGADTDGSDTATPGTVVHKNVLPSSLIRTGARNHGGPPLPSALNAPLRNLFDNDKGSVRHINPDSVNVARQKRKKKELLTTVHGASGVDPASFQRSKTQAQAQAVNNEDTKEDDHGTIIYRNSSTTAHKANRPRPGLQAPGKSKAPAQAVINANAKVGPTADSHGAVARKHKPPPPTTITQKNDTRPRPCLKPSGSWQTLRYKDKNKGKDTKDPQNAQNPKEPKDPQNSKNSKNSEDTKDTRDTKESQTPNNTKDRKDRKNVRKSVSFAPALDKLRQDQTKRPQRSPSPPSAELGKMADEALEALRKKFAGVATGYMSRIGELDARLGELERMVDGCGDEEKKA